MFLSFFGKLDWFLYQQDYQLCCVVDFICGKGCLNPVVIVGVF